MAAEPPHAVADPRVTDRKAECTGTTDVMSCRGHPRESRRFGKVGTLPALQHEWGVDWLGTGSLQDGCGIKRVEAHSLDRVLTAARLLFPFLRLVFGRVHLRLESGGLRFEVGRRLPLGVGSRDR